MDRALGRGNGPGHSDVVGGGNTRIGNTYHGYPPAGTDPIAVTDDSGEFAIGSAVAFVSMELNIEAPLKARGIFPDVRPGMARRDFVVTEGVFLTGRVVAGGGVVSNVVVGACGTDRTLGNFTGDFSVAAKADGTFELAHLPPNREYYVYGQMASLRDRGTLPVRRLKAGGDGVVQDLGDWRIEPGRRLAGKVRLSDREVLPPSTRLLISREGPWDSLTVPTGPADPQPGRGAHG